MSKQDEKTDMKSEEHHTTVVGLTGHEQKHLHMLANLSPKISDPEAIWSVITTLAHKPDFECEREYMVESWLTAMDETPSGQLFAVSMDGELHYTKKGEWTVKDLKCPDGLNAIWAASDTLLFAVGGNGCRVKIEETMGELTLDKKERGLNAVHGTSPENVYAVGEEGVIFHFDGDTWSEIESPTNGELFAVLCHREDVYFAGQKGVVFRLTKGKWKELHLPDKTTATSLAWFDGTLFAATGLEGLFRLEPDGFELVKKRIFYELKIVGKLLFCYGNNLIAQFDGKEWWGGEIDL
jgi:hypothetical protein